MSNFRLFFLFCSALYKFLHVTCNLIEHYMQYFLFLCICVLFSRNNVCKKTAFFLVYTKKSTMLCFWVLINCSMRVICKLHHVFLAQVYTVSIKNRQKKNRIASHMQKFKQIRAKSKNSLKFDIGRLRSQPFNLYIAVA